MSLDVYLTLRGEKSPYGSGIFIREDGQTREITREEWEERFPGSEPVVCQAGDNDGEVFSWNITHNLTDMAAKAGLYTYLWRPEEANITLAAQLIKPLEAGLAELIDKPAIYRQFNPSNGWGDYEGIVAFVQAYLTACKQYPNAQVSVSR